MDAGVDPIGPMDETSVQGTISWKVVISNRRVWIGLIALVALMTGIAPDQVVVLAREIGNWL
tara:strand:+ start:1484 stop:1669 length:186 start_codon:yes stop_codon:yes gene_type:complete